MVRKKTHEAWQDESHAKYFDGWHNLTISGLKRNYERLNEIKLFLSIKDQVSDKSFLEVGCATGELYRYLNHFHREYFYTGIDISVPAIKRAKVKYPNGSFFIADEDEPLSKTVMKLNIKPSVLFARDVVIHQTDPFGFLMDMLSIPSDYLILRIRTKDTGATELDPEYSCQWHYEKWVPYMVLNTDELLSLIKKHGFCESIYITKNYMQLGGHEGRFLPKDCYLPETGTSETAICFKLSGNRTNNPKIVINEQKDTISSLSLFDRKISHLFKSGKKLFIK